MTTHVFIVDSTTLKIHLEYMFAGTGAVDNVIDFNNSDTTTLSHPTENMLVSMIADASRIRAGDLIIFYLQQNFSRKILDGKFFGVFRATQDLSFLDNNDPSQYLRQELDKSLTFRILIEPYKVYPEGVSEWEALDDISHLQSPNQMLWSLIYRKLKGKRGNTMITIYESERLFQLIRDKNSRRELNLNDSKLSFDEIEQKIITTSDPANKYTGRTEPINVFKRLISKYNAGLSFEAHLQAYIVQCLGRGLNKSLDDNLLIPGSDIVWLGNEVSCGVGMQRIDVMPLVEHNDQKILIPVELKSVQADIINVNQIQRYIDWLEQYYKPNMQCDIQPVLIAKKITDQTSARFTRVKNAFDKFNKKNAHRSHKLKYIDFVIDGNGLIFNEVSY